MRKRDHVSVSHLRNEIEKAKQQLDYYLELLDQIESQPDGSAWGNDYKEYVARGGR